ncbi:MAG TPA: FliM/FliN family flagellar motor switch protein [Pirellulales bacterium]|jgi:flagellar motor switch protein FliM
MAVVLTHADVKRLLTAREQPTGTSLPLQPVDDALTDFSGNVRQEDMGHDIASSEQLGDERIQDFQLVYERISQNYAAALSALLRSTAEVKLASIQQAKYGEFVSGLRAPTCVNVLKIDPLAAQWILEINPSILFPIIDRLLGGGREPAPPVRRPLTEIELRLAARITGLFLEENRRAWADQIDLRISIDRVESYPARVHDLSADDNTVLISFEITLNQSHGTMNLCMPLKSTEGLGPKLFSDGSLEFGRNGTDSKDQTSLHDGALPMVAQMAASKISAADLVGLRVGDMITTEQLANAPIVVSVDGTAKYHAQLGALDGRKAIRIVEVVESGPESPHSDVGSNSPVDQQ